MRLICVFILLASVILLPSLIPAPCNIDEVQAAIDYYKVQSTAFAVSTVQLASAIDSLDPEDAQTIYTAIEALKNSRLHYKRIEFFLDYFFKSAARVYNSPAKYEVEGPEMEYVEPIGLQVIEEILFSKEIGVKKDFLLQQAAVIVSSAKDLNSLLYAFKASNKQLMESVRLEIIRVITLNITGYDAPLLKSGITESYESLSAVQTILQPFINANNKQADEMAGCLKKSIRYLKLHPDFDRFDRLAFLTNCVLPLQKQLGLFIAKNNLELNTTNGILNYGAENIFSSNAIDAGAFAETNMGISINGAMIDLGKKLFFEKALSGNNKMSCASCHQPGKYFTDGLPKSVAFNDSFFVKRNAPSLFYASFQHNQFWDGRAKGLEAQVIDVMNNTLEMNSRSEASIKALEEKEYYKTAFAKAFCGRPDSSVSTSNIAISIAAYIKTLNPRNSAFDRFMNGTKNALSQQQQNGFNLFMGKAMCGTCHFAPLFNGLLPPLYSTTEVEVLGVPASDNFSNPSADKDSGRYSFYPIKFYLGAFKTPSVRNASKTAPYMHNGAFKSLEKVMDFYNKGGGAGIGVTNGLQTLSPRKLKLNKQEIRCIISFINAITDTKSL